MSFKVNPEYKPKERDYINTADLSDEMVQVLLSEHPEWFPTIESYDARQHLYLEWFNGGFCRTDWLVDCKGGNNVPTNVLFVDDGYQSKGELAITFLMEHGYVWDEAAHVWLDGDVSSMIKATSSLI